MLQKITLTRFQSHESTEIEFVPGVNIITGESDQGKSAIIRGALWAVTNRPQGFAFRKLGAGKKDLTSVRLEFDSGVVERRRSDDINEYVVNDTDTFAALRSGVPDQVSAIVNMASCAVQGQFEKHFMLQESPGDVGKMLCDLVGLSHIDMVLTAANAVVTQHKNKAEHFRQTVERTQEQLAEYEHLDDEISLASQLRDVVQALEFKRKRADAIETLAAESRRAKKALGALPDTAEDRDLVREIAKKVVILEQKENRAGSLELLAKSVGSLAGQLDALEDLTAFADDVAAAADVCNRAVLSVKHGNKLRETLTSIEGYRLELLTAKKNYEEALSLFEDLKQRVKVCPVCGGVL